MNVSRRLSPRAGRRIAWFFVIAGVLIVLIASVQLAKVAAFVNRAEAAMATVVEVERVRNSDADTYRPTFRFDTPGGTVETATNSSSSTWNFRSGDSIEILYDPKSPSDAKPQGFLGVWGFSVLIGIIGFGWTVIGSMGLLLMKRQGD